MKRSAPKRSTKRIARRKRPPPKNVERAAAEFVRCFGSAERVEWVKAGPCVNCGVLGFTDNAHIHGAEGSGANRRGNFDQIIRLCHSRFTTVGCHELYDDYKIEIDGVVEAAMLDAEWQRALARNPELQNGEQMIF